jgi:S-adenosylmethionine decarboxylase proenzyme
MTGTHIIIDISNIEDNEILKYESTIIPILNKIVDKYKLNVVGKAIHQFQPFGVTGVYILAESHLSIHTFVEERQVAMDLYTCTRFTNTDDLEEFFKSLFNNKCDLNYKIIER